MTLDEALRLQLADASLARLHRAEEVLMDYLRRKRYIRDRNHIRTHLTRVVEEIVTRREKGTT